MIFLPVGQGSTHVLVPYISGSVQDARAVQDIGSILLTSWSFEDM